MMVMVTMEVVVVMMMMISISLTSQLLLCLVPTILCLLVLGGVHQWNLAAVGGS